MLFIKKIFIYVGLVLGGAVLLTVLPASLTSCGSSKQLNNDSPTTTVGNIGVDGIIAEPEALKEMPTNYQLPEKQISVKPTSGDSWTAKSAEEYWQKRIKNYTLQDYKNDLEANIIYQNQILTKKMPYFNWTSMSNSKNNPNDLFRQFMCIKLTNISMNKDKSFNFIIKTSLVTQISNSNKKIISQQSLNYTFEYLNSRAAPFLFYSNDDVYSCWEPYLYSGVNIKISQSNLLNFNLLKQHFDSINSLPKNVEYNIKIGNVDKLLKQSLFYKPNWDSFNELINDLSNLENYTFSSKNLHVLLMDYSYCSLSFSGLNYNPGLLQSSNNNNFSFGNIQELTKKYK